MNGENKNNRKQFFSNLNFFSNFVQFQKWKKPREKCRLKWIFEAEKIFLEDYITWRHIIRLADDVVRGSNPARRDKNKIPVPFSMNNFNWLV